MSCPPPCRRTSRKNQLEAHATYANIRVPPILQHPADNSVSMPPAAASRSANLNANHGREHLGAIVNVVPRIELWCSRARGVCKEIQRKGYRHAIKPTTADLSMDFTIGSHERTGINWYSEPSPVQVNKLGPVRRGGLYRSDIDAHQVREGS